LYQLIARKKKSKETLLPRSKFYYIVTLTLYIDHKSVRFGGVKLHEFDKNSTPNPTKPMPSVNDSPSTPTTTTRVLRKPTKKTTPDSVKPTELTTPVLSVKPCSTTEPTEPGSPRNELRDKEALKECFNASLSSPATTDAVTTAPLNQAPLLSYPNPFRRVQEPVEPDQ